VGENIFLTFSDTEKASFVKNLYDSMVQYNQQYLYEALTQRYYAPYLLLILIERDRYRKLSNYEYFQKTIDAVTLHDLEEMSKNP
jgi:hypothetical protein